MVNSTLATGHCDKKFGSVNAMHSRYVNQLKALMLSYQMVDFLLTRPLHCDRWYYEFYIYLLYIPTAHQWSSGLIIQVNNCLLTRLLHCMAVFMSTYCTSVTQWIQLQYRFTLIITYLLSVYLGYCGGRLVIQQLYRGKSRHTWLWLSSVHSAIGSLEQRQAQSYISQCSCLLPVCSGFKV